MLRFSRTAKAVAAYSGILLSSKALTLAASYLAALVASDEEFGYFTLAQATFVAASTLFGFNTGAAYVRHYFTSGVLAVVRSLRRVYLLFFVVALLAGMIASFVFRNDPQLVWFGALPLAGMLAAWAVAANSIQRCSGDIVGFGIAELGRPGIVLVFICAWIVLRRTSSLQPPLVAMYASALLVSLAAVVWLSIIRLRSILTSEAPAELSESSLVRYLLPLVAVQVMALANNVGDRFILSAYVTVEAIGAYGKAYLVGATFGMLVDSVVLLWSPYVVKHRDAFEAKAGRLVRIVFAGATAASLIALALGLSAYAIDARIASFDRTFIGTAIVVLAAYLGRIGYQVYVPILSAYDKTKGVARISGVGTLLGVVGNLVLIPAIGTLGAAVATWIAFFTFSTLAFVAVQRGRHSVAPAPPSGT